MKWSVSLVAEGDRVVSLDEIVELADAVAGMGGIASGVGSMSYGAQLVIDAPNADDAVELALPAFVAAAERAGLPNWPVTRAEAVSEVDDMEEPE
jgi:hypothetical protein